MNKILSRPNFVALVLIATGILADQLSKLWVLAHLPGNPRTLIPGALSLVYAENRNMAFGVGKSIPESVKATGLIALTSLLAVALLILLVRSTDWSTRLTLSLIVAGAIGNIIDRVRLGFVVDFIYWHGGFTWPNFNLADSFICVGAGLMILACFRNERATTPSASPHPETENSQNRP